MKLERAIIEELIYGSQATHRYTQDSPVLADVWIQYGEKPAEAQPLLLTPRFGSNSGEVSVALRRKVDEHRAGFADRGPARIAYNQIYVAATLHFDELVRLVLPMTRWWSWLWRASWRTLYQEEREHPEQDVPLAEIIRGLELTLESSLLAMQASGELFQDEYMADLPSELPWLMQLLGALMPLFEASTSSAPAGPDPVSRDREDSELTERATSLVRREQRATQSLLRKELGIGATRARRLLGSLEQRGVIGPQEGRRARRVLEPDARTVVRERLAGVRLLLDGLSVGKPAETESAWVWLVNRNREARTAVYRSRLAVKADAAEHLFHIDTGDLAWAIVDSGIDASHPAFFRRPKPGEEDPRGVGEAGEVWPRWTRVKATYDFTQIHRLLDPLRLEQLTRAFQNAGSDPKQLQRALSIQKVPKSLGLALARPENAQTLRRLQERLKGGGAIDWKQVVPFLRVEHDHEKGYRRPKTAHGTHVAGILGANWEARKLVGVCRDIGLYDLRVLEQGSPNDEFTVLAALQFVQWLNSQKDFFAIHGVNLSLSIRQDVANFACGRTPVCDQSEVLVSSGVTVVAAAGNDGYLKYKTERGKSEEITEGYHTVSISDPGNAENVITVGSTHRFQPHTYGVSYFSSRGPTGDGRIKPDLVAPGEKINSTVPQRGERKLDGTSMATAHVSGAAAMLMARYTELIGQPAKIKKALTTTATDLGREQYFQGAGMLDVLRALQSI